ncbi:MAG: YHS domain-containing protein [Gammaproteobacteria bacterium]|jgi:YHS domain-containing protein
MKSIQQLFFGLSLSFFVGSVFAVDAINTPWYSNVAIEGHDPVAYFLERKPVEGSKSHKLNWSGVSWHFKSAENKTLFEANPEKYAPQYGGYCAWAASQNTVAGIDPEQWTIVDGKLYLNYNREVKGKWLVDTSKSIADGNKNWPGLLVGN